MKIETKRLRGLNNKEELSREMDAMIREANEASSPISISDLMLSQPQTSALIARLRTKSGAKYIIHAICDEKGRALKPGDKVYRRRPKSLYVEPGKPYPEHELSKMVRAKKFETEMNDFDEFELDSKCCFRCTADDAFYFLSNFGIDSESGTVLSMHLNPTSFGDVPPPEDKKHQYTHYHRFEEFSAEQYSKAPSFDQAKK